MLLWWTSPQEKIHSMCGTPIPDIKRLLCLYLSSERKETCIWDEKGNKYLDAIASWWVNPHGHCNDYIIDKIYQQLQTLDHILFTGFTHDSAINLAERLLNLMPLNQKKIFYSDNGSTAVEMGVKIALQHFENQNIRKRRILAFENGFHGETFGAMAASGTLFFKEFSDYFVKVDRVPVPTEKNKEEVLRTFESILKKGNTACFIFEPLVQAAAGMVMYHKDTLDQMIKLCKDHNTLTLADEVMTGFGKTGTMFACDQLQNKPDIMVLSKALAAGVLPLAVTSCTQDIFDTFYRNNVSLHGHTFTANPISCSASLASLDLFEQPNHPEQIQGILKSYQAFDQEIRQHPNVLNTRKLGVIYVVTIKSEDTAYYGKFRNRLYNFFVNESRIVIRPIGNMIYILPPFCITQQELKRVYYAIQKALDTVV